MKTILNTPGKIQINFNYKSIPYPLKGIITLLFTTIYINLFAISTFSDEGWKLDKTVNNVNCYYKLIECNGLNTVFLKFDNKNKYSVKILWKEVFTTQAENSKEGSQGQKELILPTGITMPLSCTDEANKKNIILASQINPAYVAKIKQFEFKDISVSKQIN